MVLKWRGSRPPPTLQECIDAEVQVKADIPREELVKEEIIKQGYSTELAVQALIRERMGDPTMMDNLVQKITDAEIKYPEK